MTKNPFDDDSALPGRVNPFGDDDDPETFDDALMRIEHAGRKMRMLRGQLGADGLPQSAMREMMLEIGRALDSTARALRDLAAKR